MTAVIRLDVPMPPKSLADFKNRDCLVVPLTVAEHQQLVEGLGLIAESMAMLMTTHATLSKATKAHVGLGSMVHKTIGMLAEPLRLATEQTAHIQAVLARSVFAPKVNAEEIGFTLVPMDVATRAEDQLQMAELLMVNAALAFRVIGQMAGKVSDGELDAACELMGRGMDHVAENEGAALADLATRFRNADGTP